MPIVEKGNMLVLSVSLNSIGALEPGGFGSRIAKFGFFCVVRIKKIIFTLFPMVTMIDGYPFLKVIYKGKGKPMLFPRYF